MSKLFSIQITLDDIIGESSVKIGPFLSLVFQRSNDKNSAYFEEIV